MLGISGVENELEGMPAEVQRKYIADHDRLERTVEDFKARRFTVVATIGSFDLLHIGHLRYLTSAKRQGDILVVGVDTDEVIRQSKGDLRPIIPFNERVEMLYYQECVDLIAPLNDLDENGRWQYGLLRSIKPDVFVAEETSYSEDQLADIARHSGRVEILPRQALQTSSTQILQGSIKRHVVKLAELVDKL